MVISSSPSTINLEDQAVFGLFGPSIRISRLASGLPVSEKEKESDWLSLLFEVITGI